MATEKKEEDVNRLSSDELLIRARQGWLIPGNVREGQFWLLVGASSMHSEKIIGALLDYLVRGKTRKESCDAHNVNSGHFSIGLNRLQHISHTAAKLSEYY